jgi:lipopolysaccharide export LptBFGC system permease protein LptF
MVSNYEKLKKGNKEMNNEKIEELMKKSGFTVKEINLLKSINKKVGTTLLDELIELEKRFYRLLFILPLSFMMLAFFFLMPEQENILGLFIAIIVLMPLAIFMTALKLSYKSFVFMRRCKKL